MAGKFESDHDFKLRLSVFKQRAVRGSVQTRPSLASLVLPRGPQEKDRDFEERMHMQEAAPFVILPRDQYESHEDWAMRLEETGEARAFWMVPHLEVPPPLLMAKGRFESVDSCKMRLGQAGTPPEKKSHYCAVVLPQAENEDDEMVELRLQAQANVGKSVVPYDPHLETVEEFEARCDA